MNASCLSLTHSLVGSRRWTINPCKRCRAVMSRCTVQLRVWFTHPAYAQELVAHYLDDYVLFGP